MCKEIGATYDEIAVAKIWQILGIKNYEQAQGKSVDRLVADLKQQRDDLLEALRNLLEVDLYKDEFHDAGRAVIAKCKT